MRLSVSANIEDVLKETTYEGLKTSCRTWHGDMTDIVDRQ